MLFILRSTQNKQLMKIILTLQQMAQIFIARFYLPSECVLGVLPTTATDRWYLFWWRL